MSKYFRTGGCCIFSTDLKLKESHFDCYSMPRGKQKKSVFYSEFTKIHDMVFYHFQIFFYSAFMLEDYGPFHIVCFNMPSTRVCIDTNAIRTRIV